MAAAALPDHEGMPPIPLDEAGPVFNEPWEAQAFALVLALYRRNHFTWPEWVEVLSGEIRHAESHGDPGGSYYLHWLRALEKLLAAKRLAGEAELGARKAELEANPPDRHGHVPRREPVAVG